MSDHIPIREFAAKLGEGINEWEVARWFDDGLLPSAHRHGTPTHGRRCVLASDLPQGRTLAADKRRARARERAAEDAEWLRAWGLWTAAVGSEPVVARHTHTIVFPRTGREPGFDYAEFAAYIEKHGLAKGLEAFTHLPLHEWWEPGRTEPVRPTFPPVHRKGLDHTAGMLAAASGADEEAAIFLLAAETEFPLPMRDRDRLGYACRARLRIANIETWHPSMKNLLPHPDPNLLGGPRFTAGHESVTPDALVTEVAHYALAIRHKGFRVVTITGALEPEVA